MRIPLVLLSALLLSLSLGCKAQQNIITYLVEDQPKRIEFTPAPNWNHAMLRIVNPSGKETYMCFVELINFELVEPFIVTKCALVIL
jgi:hypothetical protein